MPDKLYKYRVFGVNALRAITEAEVFYAKPSAFNDPLDCNPTIDIDSDRADLERLLYRMLSECGSKVDARAAVHNLRWQSEYFEDRTEQEIENSLIWMLAGGIKRQLEIELGNAGVLSLSATWKSGLMWSHYADEHRGICIEYDTRDQEHPRLEPVDYKGPRAVKTSDLFRWKVKRDGDARNQVFKTYFYTKSSEWRYEREWRDVKEESGVHGVPFRPTAILFGLRCNVAVVKSVVKLLSNCPAIKIWQVLPKDDGFGLRRHQLDRGEIEARAIREPPFLVWKNIVWAELDDDVPF